MTWTPDRVALLQKLWDEGKSTAEIGRQLGVTKNAVVGKAHRMGLPSRPSPISRRRLKAVMASPLPKPGLRAFPRASADAEPDQMTRGPKGVAPGGTKCQWPIGDPRERGFHFCGAEAEAGRSYCAEHCAQAYIRSEKEKAA